MSFCPPSPPLALPPRPAPRLALPPPPVRSPPPSRSLTPSQVVLGFLVPPGAGKDGVPLQTLFGFERVHVPAGATVSVYLYPSLADLTHTQLDGTKRALAGEWTVKFGVKETAVHGQGYAEAPLTTY